MSLESLDGTRLKLLFELSRSFSEHTDLDALLETVLSRCRQIFGGDVIVGIMFIEPESGDLYFPYIEVSDPAQIERLKQIRIPAGDGIAGAVLRTGRAELVLDAQKDPRHRRDMERDHGFSVGSLLLVPLFTREGTIGLMTVSKPRGGSVFSYDDLIFLESLGSCVALAIENAQMYARMRESEEELRLQIGALQRDLERRDRFPEIIGTSNAMRDLIKLMESAAASPIAVLIEGETGTGKELVSRGIHRASPRGDGPFLAVNCGAFTESLLETELFGHERGAFTGAERAKRGLLEVLSGGSILLDEVGEMPPSMQVKLLRVLQEGEVIPVGSTSGRKVDVRVISASNRKLEAEVASGRFRADLYYRLAGFPIRVPPLSERREDIPVLTDHLLQLAAASHDKQVGGISPAARAVLARHSWPGNVRQLKNEIERAVALAQPGAMIESHNLSESLLASDPEWAGERDAQRHPAASLARAASATAPASVSGRGSLRAARADFETRYIADVLDREGGNVSRAAEVLGISRVMLHKKLKLLGLR